MKIQSLLLGIGAVVLVGGAYGVSRVLLSPSAPEVVPPPPPTFYGTMSMPSGSGMMSPMTIKPSRRIDSPIYSPNGRFLAFRLSKVRSQDSTSNACVLDAQAGKVLACGDENYAYSPIVWKGPNQLFVGSQFYFLVQSGQKWKFDRAGGAPGAFIHPPTMFDEDGGETLDVSQEETLHHADLALWFVRSPTSGTGRLGASSLATGQEIPLPVLQKPTYVTRTANFAAPPFRKGAPRLLATLHPASMSSFNSILEVWNLSARRLILKREYNGMLGTSLHWTRDGRFLMVMNVERPAKDMESMEGIDIFDGRTGKLNNALSLPIASSTMQQGPPAVSPDGRYLLTRERGAKENAQRLVIRAIPSGRILGVIERDHPISAQPKFAEHDSNLLVWASEDTIFTQRWKPGKKPQKLAPRRVKLALNAPVFG
ncbi:MAG: hypothetical protein EOO38_20140, partial [Cytophagaceae bacterium]